MPNNPKRDSPPEVSPELSPAELRRRAAEAGDVDYLWHELTERSWSELNVDQQFRLLLQALEVRAHDDPSGFAQAFFERAAAFSSLMSMRLQMWITWKMSSHDGQRRRPYELGDEIKDQLLPSLIETQRHTSDLLDAQAGVRRKHELARNKKLENDLLETELRRKSEQSTQASNGSTVSSRNGHAKTATHRTSNGHGHNRITDLVKGTT